MNSTSSGLSGLPFWFRWLVFALGVSVFQAMDIGSTLTTARAAGSDLTLARAVLDGFSSAAVVVAMYPALRPLLSWATPWSRRYVRFVLGNLAGLAAFTAVHVAGYMLIRAAAYPAIGETFRLPPSPWIPGQLLREATTYGLIASLIWFIDWVSRRGRAVAPPTSGPAILDIRDGARVIRVPISAILAVRAAGNYAEFLLEDGRRPMMRTTLANLEAGLAPHGFARTHRAWLVNRAHVAELAPAGSGDATLKLTNGMEAPVSRRLRRALVPLTR